MEMKTRRDKLTIIENPVVCVTLPDNSTIKMKGMPFNRLREVIRSVSEVLQTIRENTPDIDSSIANEEDLVAILKALPSLADELPKIATILVASSEDLTEDVVMDLPVAGVMKLVTIFLEVNDVDLIRALFQDAKVLLQPTVEGEQTEGV